MTTVVGTDIRHSTAGGGDEAAATTRPAQAAAMSSPVSAPVTARWWPEPARVLVLVACDLAALLAGMAFAYAVWANPVHHHGLRMYAGVAWITPVFIVGYALSGLYPGFGLGAVEILKRLSTRTSFTFVVLAAFVFIFKLPTYYSRVSFVLAWAASLVTVPTFRYALLNVVANRWWWGTPTVVVGDPSRVEQALKLLNSALSLCYRPVGVLVQGEAPAQRQVAGVPVLGTLGLAPEVAARGVHTALVLDGDDPHGGAAGAALQRYFRHVVLLRDFEHLPVEGVAIRNLGGVLGIEFTNDLLRRHHRVVKRTMDIVLGGAALAISLPVMALAAVAIRLASRGPVFFSQDREGLDGARIRVWKLRTMYVDGEERLQRYLETNALAREAWKSCFKLRDDPRVVRTVGSLLRRFSIDELPQLWCVVRGDMSLVGPRPFPEYHLENFSDEFRALRRHVRPGLSGMWQVMVRSDGGLDEQRLFDTYYIRNWSVWLDLYILAKTPLVVMAGKGAY
jgi:Undecaprenyl-phosphate galactose phosphotransferase WbaP